MPRKKTTLSQKTPGAKRARLRRSCETPEQHAARLAKERQRVAAYRSNETEEERKARIRYGQEQRKKLWQHQLYAKRRTNLQCVLENNKNSSNVEVRKKKTKKKQLKKKRDSKSDSTQIGTDKDNRDNIAAAAEFNYVSEMQDPLLLGTSGY